MHGFPEYIGALREQYSKSGTWPEKSGDPGRQPAMIIVGCGQLVLQLAALLKTL